MTRRPSWKDAAPLPASPEGNVGLRFTKHFDHWVLKDKQWRLQDRAASDWLEGVLKTAAGREATTAAELVTRTQRLVEHLGGRCWTMQTLSRLIIGSGNAHPLENGLTWHPVLGVPYLPASGLKGLTRWYAVHMTDACDPDTAQRVFGGPRPGDDGAAGSGEGAAGGAGSVIFFDALPATPSARLLDWDVMTPHYGPWYMAGDPATAVPGDWYDPNPISFLTVKEAEKFHFALAPRVGTRDGGQAARDVDLAHSWLTKAAEEFGVGAKTSVGYGLLGA